MKKPRTSSSKRTPQARETSAEQAAAALSALKKLGSSRIREEMLSRYGIQAPLAFGVSMANMKTLAKQLGHDHDLAAALWETGWYEARIVASFVEEPTCVTPAQMDRWSGGFDNWAICDTVCFHLFDRTPHAWKKVAHWSRKREEFVKRAAFALLWGLTVHDKQADDPPFLDGLTLIERAATDERHFVKKAVNMALRAIGKRNAALRAAAVSVAERLADSSDAVPRWIGKDALRELAARPKK